MGGTMVTSIVIEGAGDQWHELCDDDNGAMVNVAPLWHP
jgi:hypothetical protein